MHKAFALILIFYYLFGNLCLPYGDFSALPDLSSMYRVCKATEHKDMTPFDFITDHLINVDGIFDHHSNGDEQKPHSPYQFHNQVSQSYFTLPEVKVTVEKPLQPIVEWIIIKENFYSSCYSPQIFRPPIV